MNLRVPDVVASAAAACGAGGWLRDLPGLIAELKAEWLVSVGRPFPHSSEAFVAEASLADSTPAVLKLLIPQDGAAGRHEITMLRLAGGRGCAGLLRDDAARGALLLERLGPSLYELGHPLAERLEILVTAAATVWRPAAGSGLPTGADKARQLVDFVTTEWEELGHPCTEAAVEHALACAARRIAAHDDERAVLVHGERSPVERPSGPWPRHVQACRPRRDARRGRVRPWVDDAERSHRAARRRPLGQGAPAGGALRAGRRGDLGVGRRGAGDERAAVHPDQPAANGSAHA